VTSRLALTSQACNDFSIQSFPYMAWLHQLGQAPVAQALRRSHDPRPALAKAGGVAGPESLTIGALSGDKPRNSAEEVRITPVPHGQFALPVWWRLDRLHGAALGPT
jgi:hypothetical protein